MTKRPNLIQQGFTVVELLIASGLLSVVMLVAAELLLRNASSIQRREQQSELLERISLFDDAAENALVNAVRIDGCGCNSSAECLYNVTTSPNCADPNETACTPSLLLEFVSEQAIDPGEPPGTQCYVATPNPRADGLIPRGCKKRMQLVLTPPTPITNTGTQFQVGTPGRLQLLELDNSGGSRILAELTGVYRVQCGFEASGTTATKTSFNLFYQVKSRIRTTSASTDVNELEGWVTSSSGDDAGFSAGIHRSAHINSPMRNIVNSGIHFGKSVTTTNCVADGQFSSDGNCCSGFRHANGTCLAVSDCIVAGQAHSGASAAFAFAECCSHRVDGGNCL